MVQVVFVRIFAKRFHSLFHTCLISLEIGGGQKKYSRIVCVITDFQQLFRHTVFG